MIVVDASAVLAILLQEADGPLIANALARAPSSVISVASVLECSMKLQRVLGPAQDTAVDQLLESVGCEVVAFDAEQLAAARDAFGRYGKGMRHAADLNFGDCLTYGLAKTRNLPLLFKGNDFIHTDIEPALV